MPSGGPAGGGAGPRSDAELLELFGHDPSTAWRLFLERYSGLMLRELGRLGMGADPAMDGFVYVCEKLAENGFRRLRSVRRLGERGELAPWLATVVHNLAINWLQAKDGRRRLLKSVAGLPPRSQRVFQLYFWQGLKPSEVVEELRRSGDDARPIEIFDCLEELFSLLTSNRLWHLVSRLARRGTASLDAPGVGGAGPPEPPSPEPDPEQRLLRKAASADLAQALAMLPVRDRLVVALRYEEALPVQEVADLTGLSLRDCERRLSSARQALRDALEARHLEPAAGLRAAR